MKKKCILLLLTFFSFSVFTQTNFLPSELNPFNLTKITDTRSSVTFGDLDNDGDLDLLSGSESVGFFYYENFGTNTNPIYGEVQVNPFDLVKPSQGNFYTPVFVDLDGDRDLDIISGNNSGQFFFYENTGNISEPLFVNPIQGAFNIVDPNFRLLSPAFGDLDNDGDLDMFAGVFSANNGNFYYFENIGTANAPNFKLGERDLFGLNDLGPDFTSFTSPYLIDFDLDGDLDLFSGSTGGDIFYIENTGTKIIPSFANAIINPFGIEKTPNAFVSLPTLVDINNDGYLDLFTGDNGGDFIYYQRETPPKTAIPDAVFEQHLIGIGLDDVLDGFVLTANINDVTSLQLNGKAVADLTGIKDFKALVNLGVQNTQLSSLNISSNINLLELRMENSPITNLDVSDNTLLTLIRMDNTLITTIDLTKNINLTDLTATNAQVTKLDFSANKNLLNVSISGSKVSTINVTSNTKLISLTISNTPIATLDLRNNSSLTGFTAINMPNLTCISVADVTLANTQGGNYKSWLKDAAISYQANCAILTYVPDDIFEQFLIDKGFDLGVLDNYIPTSKIADITSIDISDLLIKDLTGLEDFSSLQTLIAKNTAITSIDITKNTALITIDIQGTTITSMDISKNVNLKNVNLSKNGLTNLDITNNPNLDFLNVSFNQIENFDINQNKKLSTLLLNDNKLKRPFLQNGANTLIVNFDIRNNPDIVCITVDNVVYSTTNWTNKDATADYSIDCNNEWTVYTTDTNFETSIKSNPLLDTNNDGEVTYQEAQAFTGSLDLKGKNIETIVGLEAFSSADAIDISDNKIKDISSFLNSKSFLVQSKTTGKIKEIPKRPKIKIRALNASNNQLTSIDISSTTGIEELYANGNDLDALNLKLGSNKSTTGFNTDLRVLDVRNNPRLSCILVDDVTIALAKTDWQKDVIADYRTSCTSNGVLSTENFLKENVAIYPNPANSFVEIALSNGLELNAVEFYNLIGKKVLTTKEKSISLQHISSGIYMIKISTDKGVIFTKLIKN